MSRKRNFSEISANEYYWDAGNKQIKHEFLELDYTGNTFNCYSTSLRDQNALHVEQTRDNQYMALQSKNLSFYHVDQNKGEEHWKNGFLGMRYFINASYLKPEHDQSASKFESKSFNKSMLSWNDNLLHGQVQRSHEEYWKYGLQGMSYFPKDPLPIMSNQNTQQVGKKNISNELLSLNNTLSKDLHRKIFIDGNFIGTVRNRNGIKQESGVGSNFQLGSNAYLEVKEGLKNVPVDILPLIEILSKNLYSRIGINKTFIGIFRNSCGKQTNEFSGKGCTRKDSDHKVVQESTIQKNSIASHCVEKSPFKFLDEETLFSNIRETDKTKNDLHLTNDEDQTTKHFGWTSGGKNILLPTDTLSQSLFHKIFFTKDFIGVVRCNRNKKYGNGFPEMKYAITETQMESDELSSEDLLPLIKILSQNLYRKITIGQDSIEILRNQITQDTEAINTRKAIVSRSGGLTNNRNAIFSEGEYLNNSFHGMSYPQNIPYYNYSQQNIPYYNYFQDKYTQEVERDAISETIPSLRDDLKYNLRVRNGQEEYWNDDWKAIFPQSGGLTINRNVIFSEREQWNNSFHGMSYQQNIPYYNYFQQNIPYFNYFQQNIPYYNYFQDKISREEERDAISETIPSLRDDLTCNQRVRNGQEEYWNDGLSGMMYSQNFFS